MEAVHGRLSINSLAFAKFLLPEALQNHIAVETPAGRVAKYQQVFNVQRNPLTASQKAEGFSHIGK
jgi:hypothetical protein